MITLKEYLKAYNKSPFYVQEVYEGQEKDKETIITYNKLLLEKYPWLTPTNSWSGKKITDCAAGEKGFWPGNPDDLPEYNYEYTNMDDMPQGWRIAFGEQMCEEIHNELVKFNYVDKYQIVQIKEKFGGLRWYDNGSPVGTLSETCQTIIKTEWKYPVHTDSQYVVYSNHPSNEEYEFKIYDILDKCKINDIISKYEHISYTTCIECGEPAKWRTTGWISYFCDDCKNILTSKGNFPDKFVPLNDLKENKESL